MSCLRVNRDSYTVLPLFCFLHSSLRYWNYFAIVDLVFHFRATYRYAGPYSTLKDCLSGIWTSYTDCPPSATQIEPLLPFSIRWIIPLATLSGLQIKQRITYVLQCDWPVVWAEDQVLSWKQSCLIQLTIYICVCVKQTKNVDWNSTHCYCYFRWIITGDLVKFRILHKIMLWQSISAQLAAHGSSHTSDPFDLSLLVGRVFLNNLARKNRK
jgi:hypothetical protein